MKELLAGLNSINKRMEEDANERKELLNDSKEMKNSLGKILKEVEGVRKETAHNTSRIDILERDIRKRNIIIFGIPEKERENMRDLENIVTEVSKKLKVEIKLEEIDHVSRMGKNREEGKNRGIMVGLTTQRKKMEIIRNKKELKDTGIYVKEHFTKEIVEKRKELEQEAKRMREQGKYAIVKFDKLIVKERKKARTIKVK